MKKDEKFAYSIQITRIKEKDFLARDLKTIEQISDFAEPLRKKDVEWFLIMYMNGTGQLLGIKLYQGGISEVKIYIREVIKDALVLGAVVMAVAHNHPNDHYAPSPSDIQVVQDLIRTTQRVDIHLVDAIIIGEDDYGKDGYYSFLEHNEMQIDHDYD